MIVLATLILLGLWALVGYGCYSVAVGKGRRGGLWFILGALFGLLALLWVALLPAVPKAGQ
jgi:hypothetical protein